MVETLQLGYIIPVLFSFRDVGDIIYSSEGSGFDDGSWMLISAPVLCCFPMQAEPLSLSSPQALPLLDESTSWKGQLP